VASTLHKTLTELARRLGIRDSAGRMIDFQRTHRFRHSRATSLLNAGVPIHVVQRYLGHLSPAMTMHYAQTLAETHEAEFLRYRKITADARDLPSSPRDLYDMLQLDKRTDRILPNGWCLLPPRQACDRGNSCLTCGNFTTARRSSRNCEPRKTAPWPSSTPRQAAFASRTGAPMEPGNVWLDGPAARDRRPRRHHHGPGTGTGSPGQRRPAGCPGSRDRRPGRHRDRQAGRNAMPGNAGNLRKAAAARTAEAAARAGNALAAMVRAGEPVTFRGLAAKSGVSLDFL